MKILHINCNYLDSWLHQNMVEQLKAKGIDNHVFTPVYCAEGHNVVPNEYVNVAVCFKKWDRIIYRYKQRKIYNKIKADYEIDKFSCIHAYTVFTDGNVARRISEKYNVPYVVAVRNTDLNDFFAHMLHLRHIGIKVLLEAKVVFFLSNSYMQQTIDKYIPDKYKSTILMKSVVIPNGIDVFWHDHLYAERKYTEILSRIKHKQIKLVFVGGIEKNKNVGLICEAKKILENNGWNIDLYVVGKVKDKRVFEKIKPYIHYVESQPKERLINIYRNSDIFVMPSHKETFGLVYAEAMSQGLPVLYTKNQGFDGQFDDGVVGFAVSDVDAEELSIKITDILNHYLDMSKNAYQNVKKFSWNVICDYYISLYNKTVNMSLEDER